MSKLKVGECFLLLNTRSDRLLHPSPSSDVAELGVTRADASFDQHLIDSWVYLTTPRTLEVHV